GHGMPRPVPAYRPPSAAPDTPRTPRLVRPLRTACRALRQRRAGPPPAPGARWTAPSPMASPRRGDPVSALAAPRALGVESAAASGGPADAVTTPVCRRPGPRRPPAPAYLAGTPGYRVAA